MNYFRCTVGGSGKGNTVTVTCAEEFAGLTITLAKTGKTYTKTCPSTAPYVVTFYGVENGTYTVSGTVDGETYSQTVVVQDISCVLNYGFSWKLWVDTASQLDSSDYDSLDEVLADEKALRELFLEHACVNYMASLAASNEDLETVINNDLCAKWINLSDYALDYLYANEIIADLMDEADKYFYGEWVITDSTTTPPTWGPKGNVPVMTSNTAPYGTVSSSGNWNNHPAYYAFDGTYNSWISASNSYSTLTYKFINPVCIKKFSAGKSLSLSLGITGTIQGSNDGSNWTTLYSLQTTDDTIDGINIENDNYYLYVRLVPTSYNFTEGTQKGVLVVTLQFYGRELKVSVPTMTSNTAPYGEAFADSVYNNSADYYAYKAFNNSNSTQTDAWISNADSPTAPHYLGYKFNNKVVVKKIVLTNRTTYPGAATKFTLQGSDDAYVWEDIEEFTNSATAASATSTYNVENNIAYRHYRIYITQHITTDGNNVCVGELRFYGLDYSEKEFEAGTTKKWLYDHGVELEELTAYGTGSVTKNENDITLDATAITKGVGVYNLMDITSYSMFYGINESISDYYKSGDPSSCIIRILSTDGASTIATASAVQLHAPTKLGLDISSINGNYRVASYAYSQKASLKELWLE